MNSLRLRSAFALLMLLPVFGLGADIPLSPPGENLAMKRSYTLEPRPNYGYCTDSADATQLTDGEYSKGHFWTQSSTVGWQHVPMAQITLDLGQVQPICGVSFNTAAGVAGVSWPTAVLLLVSDDGKSYFEVGELTSLSAEHGLPSAEGYRVHRFWTGKLATHGRYIKVMAVGGPYLFVDEIEVYRGPESLKTQPFAGQPVTDSGIFFRKRQVRTAMIRRIVSDVQAVRAETGEKPEFEAELKAIAAEADKLPDVDPAGFKAVLPLNDLHARLFRVQAAFWRAGGAESLVAWQNPLWDPLNVVAALPRPAESPRVDVAMMPGEYRAGAFNLSSSFDRELNLRLKVENLPEGCLTIHEVAWTDTKRGVPVAAALPEAKHEGNDFQIRVSSGLTRQVWLTFHPSGDVKPGRYEGRIVVRGDDLPSITVPLVMRLSSIRFPARPTFSLGGFDYTDSDAYSGMKLSNREALISHLREHFVDTPWGSGAVMPNPPDFRRLDAWLDRWPEARHYRVFNSVGKSFAGHTIGSAEFDKAVGVWISAYVKHWKERGIDPKRFGLLLVDEPHSAEQNEVIVAWAKAVRAVEPEVLIWEDPTFKDAAQARDIFPLSDVLCPNRPMWIEGGKPFQKIYADQRAAGKVLNFYSCSGPVRSLDPYAYHRLQAWTCWQQGATAMFYWAFGDNGAGSDWNEYATPGTSFSPAFLAPDGVTAAKHMEAVREGVEDYEYFVLLRDRIAAIERSGKSHEKLAAAKELLATAADAVLADQGVDKLNWNESKDRTLADRLRVQILDLLEALGTVDKR